MGRHPSGNKRWPINVWVTPEERAEVERRLAERGIVPAHVARDALRAAAGLPPRPDDEGEG